jgi:hypothetical protein
MAECSTCPIGKYCPRSEVSDPLLCYPGKICSEEGLTFPNATCPKGYVCLAGTITSIPPKDKLVYDKNIPYDDSVTYPLQCPKGYMCQGSTGGFNQGKSIEPIPCGLNYYAQNTGQWECNICDNGFECIDPSGVNINPHRCNAGYYKGDNNLQ